MPLLGGTSLADCRELALHARDTGLNAVSFTSPYYFNLPSVEALAACCYEVAATVPDMPFYYYHIPVLSELGFSDVGFVKSRRWLYSQFAGLDIYPRGFHGFSFHINIFGMENMICSEKR